MNIKKERNVFPLTKRPEIPDDLTGEPADLWHEVVNSLPGEYLRPADLPLLRAYVLAVTRWREAERMLAADGLVIDGRPHPALMISDQQAKLMMALSGKLRLCPSSRIRAEDAGLRKAHEGPTTNPSGRFFT